MKLKKVYLEITNRCNLSCSFCIKNNRPTKDITPEDFKFIIDKIKNYTKEVYFHVLGEPLLHKDINDFIDYANLNGILVNITTNGYLIDKIADNKNIKRLNISLHSYTKESKISLDTYLENVFNSIDKLRKYTYITIRLWVKDELTKEIIDYINKRYNISIDKITDNQKIKITNNLLLDSFHKFIWPDLENNHYEESGSCQGLIDHIGILSDGTIVPCCLDTKGIINLGNILKDDIDTIFNKPIVKDMIKGFKENRKTQELCKHCHFLEVKNESLKLEK